MEAGENTGEEAFDLLSVNSQTFSLGPAIGDFHSALLFAICTQNTELGMGFSLRFQTVCQKEHAKIKAKAKLR